MIKILVIITIIQSAPLRYFFNYIANSSLFHLLTGLLCLNISCTLAQNLHGLSWIIIFFLIIFIFLIIFWVVRNLFTKIVLLFFFFNFLLLIISGRILVVVGKMFANSFDEFQAQRKLSINFFEILICKPDRFRDRIEIAVDISAKNSRIKAYKSVFNCITLLSQVHYHVVQT